MTPNKETLKKVQEMLSVGLMAQLADAEGLTDEEFAMVQEMAYRFLQGQATDQDWIEAMELLIPYDMEIEEE